MGNKIKQLYDGNILFDDGVTLTDDKQVIINNERVHNGIRVSLFSLDLEESFVEDHVNDIITDIAVSCTVCIEEEGTDYCRNKSNALMLMIECNDKDDKIIEKKYGKTPPNIIGEWETGCASRVPKGTKNINVFFDTGSYRAPVKIKDIRITDTDSPVVPFGNEKKRCLQGVFIK